MTRSPVQPLWAPAPLRGGAPVRILAAAEKLFAEHGYEAVSISAIAARAGISKANVFHHFSSKRDLYLAVIRGACRDAAAHPDRLEARRGSFQERFSGYAVDTLAGMLGHERLHRLTLRALLAEEDAGLAQELAGRAYGDTVARLVAILREGQVRGELRRDFEPGMAAIALIGANLFFLQSRHVYLPDAGAAGDAPRYGTLLADILLRGLLSPSAAGTPS